MPIRRTITPGKTLDVERQEQIDRLRAAFDRAGLDFKHASFPGADAATVGLPADLVISLLAALPEAALPPAGKADEAAGEG